MEDEEARASLAATKETTLDATTVAILSEQGGIFILKQSINRAFLCANHCFTDFTTLCGAWRLAAG